MIKALYKPFAILSGLMAGMIAGAVFKQVWKLARHEEDAPSADDEDRLWKEVLPASAAQGAIVGVVKAVLQRGGATGVRRVTGTWPA